MYTRADKVLLLAMLLLGPGVGAAKELGAEVRRRRVPLVQELAGDGRLAATPLRARQQDLGADLERRGGILRPAGGDLRGGLRAIAFLAIRHFQTRL